MIDSDDNYKKVAELADSETYEGGEEILSPRERGQQMKDFMLMQKYRQISLKMESEVDDFQAELRTMANQHFDDHNQDMLIQHEETNRRQLFENPNFVAKESDQTLSEQQGNIKQYINQV